MSVAVLPGSYDPITVGHLAIIERALATYDDVVVAVMNNAEKHYLLTLAERAELVAIATAPYPRVRVVADEGLLVDLFDRVGGDVIVKGVRNDKDLAYEEAMAAYNLSKNPRAKTVFLSASEDFSAVSSTAVREKLLRGEEVSSLLPPGVPARLITLLENKETYHE